jgi:hypothetical protein
MQEGSGLPLEAPPSILSSFNRECKQIAITFLHTFLHHVSSKLALEKINVITSIGQVFGLSAKNQWFQMWLPKTYPDLGPLLRTK